MRSWPRNLQFEYRKRTYGVHFHWEPIPPTQECSNLQCDDGGDFAGAIVIQKIFHASKHTRMVLLAEEAPEWNTVADIVRKRLGHGQTHCRTPRPPQRLLCEQAMNFQNYVATFIEFGVSINSQGNWHKIAEKALQERLQKDRALRVVPGFALRQPQMA